MNALWGLFIGDALAMPAHWFYSLENLRKTFRGGVRGYEEPPHPHPDSFMVGMAYHPNVEKAEALGRPYDILHEHARFYDTNYSDLEIPLSQQESEHGNPAPAPEDRYHYHHGLRAGENTTAADLVRVLLRSVADRERYDEQHFLDEFVGYMTEPGRRRDPYVEIYLRRWFENYSEGLPPSACAERQRAVWSIGSHGGMIRPMVLSMLADSAYPALGFAGEHQNLTHRSESVTAALGVVIPLLHDLLNGADPVAAITEHARSLRLPKITGRELTDSYRRHNGPGNIPSREMWRLHTELTHEPLDLRRFVEENPEENVAAERLATACYPEHGLPLVLYQAIKHELNPESALLAGVNAGGDNVHRNAVLGLLLGAARTEEMPGDWVDSLVESRDLEREIAAFAEVADRAFPW